VWVIKRSGEREQFDRSKTKAAIMRVDVSDAEAEEMLDRLEPQLYDGISTEEIYRRVRQMLEGRRAIRYGLKKALLRLGPDGMNFETLVGRIFQAEGYAVEVRRTVSGKCVSHEVDGIARRGDENYMIECKFHNSLGIKCTIQCALYTYARFLDVREKERFTAPYLVTNTRFTSDVDRYAACVGMKVLGWNWPVGAGLETKMDRYQIYPVTMLDLRRYDQATLLENGILLISDILDHREKVQRLLSRPIADELIGQAEQMLGR
jgi:hypothetical protein